MKIEFGKYRQQEASADDNQPIQWHVLKYDDREALLLSRCCLDVEPYHFKHIRVAWMECNLHAWLYEVFLPRAFSVEEQKLIHLRPMSAARDGEEGLTLLAKDEVRRYFPSPTFSVCMPTAYALWRLHQKGDLRTEQVCSWWLREPEGKRAVAPIVNRMGLIGEYKVTDYLTLVRPAIYVDRSVLSSSPLCGGEEK